VRAQLADSTRVQLPQTADAARAGYLAAVSQYRSLAAPPRPNVVWKAAAAIAVAQADVNAARRRVAEGTVRAPVDGTVRAIDVHPGDLLAADASVASIDESGRPFARIFVPQSDLGAVRIGTRVSVRSDSLSDRTFVGTVAAVDARAQFTPQNVQTASDRAVLSFGVKVYVDDPHHRLFGGTTVEVRVP
jgi:HlyD family secretion protein